MKIINLESIDGGYAGFCTPDFRQYHRFRITPGSRLLTQLRLPDKVDGYQAFIELWRQVDPSVDFFSAPISVPQLTLESLRRSAKSAAAS